MKPKHLIAILAIFFTCNGIAAEPPVTNQGDAASQSISSAVGTVMDLVPSNPIAATQPTKKSKSVKPNPLDQWLSKELNLSDVQQDKLKMLRKQTQAQLQQVNKHYGQPKMLSQSVLVQLKSEQWNDIAVRQAITADSARQEAIHYYKIKHLFELNKILTPQQRTKLVILMQQKRLF